MASEKGVVTEETQEPYGVCLWRISGMATGISTTMSFSRLGMSLAFIFGMMYSAEKWFSSLHSHNFIQYLVTKKTWYRITWILPALTSIGI